MSLFRERITAIKFTKILSFVFLYVRTPCGSCTVSAVQSTRKVDTKLTKSQTSGFLLVTNRRGNNLTKVRPNLFVPILLLLLRYRYATYLFITTIRVDKTFFYALHRFPVGRFVKVSYSRALATHNYFSNQIVCVYVLYWRVAGSNLAWSLILLLNFLLR